ncbi:MAG TPA: hypothetical protein DCP91_10050 [Eggerthellaceae bacterium]|nr:hypothetical protein [Eggerthellaceae bacterium]
MPEEASLAVPVCDELAVLAVLPPALVEFELAGCDEHPISPTIEQASKADAANPISLFDVVFMMRVLRPIRLS